MIPTHLVSLPSSLDDNWTGSILFLFLAEDYDFFDTANVDIFSTGVDVGQIKILCHTYTGVNKGD